MEEGADNGWSVFVIRCKERGLDRRGRQGVDGGGGGEKRREGET